MEENSKINRRSRPRPYDLRRKVLLKNFLREQMTYIPQTRLTSTVQNSDANFTVESSNSLELDEDLQELNDENSSSSSVTESGDSKSSENVEENHLMKDVNDDGNVNNTDKPAAKINSTDAPTHEPKFFRFASLMNLRSESKKKKVKGILKAKKVCKTVKSPVKSKSFKRLFSGRSRTSRESSQDQAAKNSPKSLFSLFKSRREQRKGREVDRIKQPTNTNIKSPIKNEKHCSSSQTVQSDDSWAREELSRVQESNKLLREENRLLSESLSYFMSSSSLDSQLNHCSSPLQSSNRNSNSYRRSSDCYDDYSSRSSYNYDNWNPRSRILRSKSVQEHSERRNVSRNGYRTRSMNCHNIQSNFYNYRQRPSVSTISAQAGDVGIPRVRKKNILASLPVNSTVRVIQRRSSMPERILSENDRSRMCRRSSSIRDGSSRTPFHSLPSEAFY